jgi:hypothetical protein
MVKNVIYYYSVYLNYKYKEEFLKKGVVMYRTPLWFFVLLLGLTASVEPAQTISLSGKVSNKMGKAISGAIVTLAVQKLKDTTDAAGAYSINGGTFLTNPAPILPNAEKISFTSGIFVLSLTKPARVRIEMFDIKGNLLERVIDQASSAGDYRFDLLKRPLAANVLIVRVSIGQRALTFRHVPVNNAVRRAGTSIALFSNGRETLEKAQAIVDSLQVTATGYASTTIAISSYIGVKNFTLDSIALAKFSFFMTSLKGLQALSNSQNGFGGDLRFGKTGQGAGLLGADSICQCLAEKSMPGSKVKIWRAFLSVSKDANGQQVNAIDRIGTGPWYDRLGRLMSNTTGDLLNDRPNADVAIKNDLPNEDGVPNHQPDPNQPAVDNHQFVTGSGTDGKLYSSTSTCQDWTSVAATGSKPRCGLSWPRRAMGAEEGTLMGGMQSWISVWDLFGCEAGLDLTETSGRGTQGVYTIGNGGGYGGFYCFALNP